VALIIKPKRGTSTPTTSDIVNGEIAIDTSAQLLYINDNGSIKTIGDGTGSAGTVTEAFKTISVSGQSDVVADTATDTLTLVAGTGMTLTTNASGDSITFASSGSTQNLFETIAVSGQSNVVADSATDTLTLAAGTGMTITTDASTDTITFASSGSYSDSDVDTHLNTSTAATNEVLSWNGSDYDWVAQSGSNTVSYLEAGMVEYEYTATSNQTTFSGSDSNSATLSYTANSIMVFLNGVLQDDGVDYTATNGTSVVFTSALAANDEVRIITIDTVASSNTLSDPTKLDAITTVNAQAAYSLTLNSSAYTPSSQNALIVSLNGITQEPGDSFTISGSTITFSPALVTGDVVDYIVDMGRAVTIGEYSGDLEVGGNLEVVGTLTKTSGSFKISHPLPSMANTHDLIHSFVESPQPDNIYSGMVTLIDGSATINIDTAADMTEGTFVLLNKNIRRTVTNEEGFTAVKSSLSGNILTITAQDSTCTDEVFWMVIGQRNDAEIRALHTTDSEGNLIVEPEKG